MSDEVLASLIGGVALIFATLIHVFAGRASKIDNSLTDVESATKTNEQLNDTFRAHNYVFLRSDIHPRTPVCQNCLGDGKAVYLQEEKARTRAHVVKSWSPEEGREIQRLVPTEEPRRCLKCPVCKTTYAISGFASLSDLQNAIQE